MNELTGSFRSRASRLVAILALAGIAFLGWKPWMGEVLAGGREERSRLWVERFQATEPDYVAFLREVEKRTEPGDVILVVSPYGLRYIAEWYLPTRTIDPYLDPMTGSAQPELIGRADWVALWRFEADLDLERVFETTDGALLRRR